MKINSIKIENIGAHKKTEIDFSGLPATVAITGQNGTGKTFLIEAVPACLYGAFPTRPGSIYDRITNGFEGEAKISIEFEINGRNYAATRILQRKRKTTSSQGFLYNSDRRGDLNYVIAGPKVKDFEQAIVNLLGPQSSFLASVFSSQKNTGDVCDARPAERKAVFAQLLGLGRYDRLSVEAKAKAQEKELELQAEEIGIEQLRDRASGLKQAQDELKVVIQSQDQGKANLEIQRSKVSALEAKIKDGEIADEKRRSLDGQVKKMDEEIRRMEIEVKADRVEYKQLKDIVDRADEIEKAESDLVMVMEKREKLQVDLQRIENEDHEKQLAHEKKISNLKTAMIAAESKKRELNRLHDQAKLLDKTPNQECCIKCSLVASAIKAKAEIPTATLSLEKVEDDIYKLERNIGTLEQHGTETIKIPLRDCISKIEVLKKLTADVPKLREAQGRMNAMTKAGISKVKAIAGKTAERDIISREALEASKKCPDLTLGENLAGAKSGQSIIENNLSELASQIGALKERILGMTDATNKADEIEKEITGTKEKVSDLRDIEKAFGRSGIQPLIIEQARPELEEIADQMLDTATNGKMRVRFETQKELKSGEMAESLDIVVSRDGFDLDIGEFSGGEQKVIRTAVRLTLAVWQARRGGNRLRTIFLDEMFDSLDRENSALMIGLIESLKNQFDRILLISHDDDLLEDCPAKINLTKNGVVQEW